MRRIKTNSDMPINLWIGVPGHNPLRVSGLGSVSITEYPPSEIGMAHSWPLRAYSEVEMQMESEQVVELLGLLASRGYRMSYAERVLVCDWPGCPNNMVCAPPMLDPDDYGWQGRLFEEDVPKYHVCPFHARESERDLLVAIANAREVQK